MTNATVFRVTACAVVAVVMAASSAVASDASGGAGGWQDRVGLGRSATIEECLHQSTAGGGATATRACIAGVRTLGVDQLAAADGGKPTDNEGVPPMCLLPGVDDRCEQWISTYDHPDGRSGGDAALAMAVSPSGDRAYVTGASFDDASGFDIATVAFDQKTGEKLWVVRHDGGRSDVDAGLDIAVSPDGSRIYVTGIENNPQGDFVTLAYDATGEPLWRSRYDGTGQGNDVGFAVAVSRDGSRVYATGRSDGPECVGPAGIYSGDCQADMATIAYDATTGQRQWVTRFQGPNPYSIDAAVALAVSSDGKTAYVTGHSSAPNYKPADYPELDYTTVAYDTTDGSQKWVARYGGAPLESFDIALDLALAPDGRRVYVTGISVGPDHYDAATIAYDATSGAELWRQRYDRGSNDPDEAFALAVSPDGASVYTTGVSAASNPLLTGFNLDYTTVAYDASSGKRRWDANYDSGATDIAISVAVAPDSKQVYVTGGAGLLIVPAGVGSIFVRRAAGTVAYDAATGAQTWIAQHNDATTQTNFDFGVEVALSTDGQRLFTLAQFVRPDSLVGNAADYALMAYDL